MHNDQIRISNPGGFVQGVTVDNLLVSEPRPRNPRLADAFKRIGLVERVGRGVGLFMPANSEMDEFLLIIRPVPSPGLMLSSRGGQPT